MKMTRTGAIGLGLFFTAVAAGNAPVLMIAYDSWAAETKNTAPAVAATPEMPHHHTLPPAGSAPAQ